MVSPVKYQATATRQPTFQKPRIKARKDGDDRTMPKPSNPPNRQSAPEPDAEEATLHKLMGALRELRRQGRLVRIRICPQCKSPDLTLLASHYDIGGAMGITPTKYHCPRCGYWGRVIIEATNEDISEEVLDDLLRSDIGSARTFLKEIEAKAKKPQ